MQGYMLKKSKNVNKSCNLLIKTSENSRKSAFEAAFSGKIPIFIYGKAPQEFFRPKPFFTFFL